MGDATGPPRDFFVAEDPDYSSAHGTDRRGGAYTKRRVPTITLDDLLAAEKAGPIDFLSLDIEGSEPAALAGLDVARYRPELVCAEIHSPRHGQAIAERLVVHGYREIAAFREIDPVNRYYAPG